MNRKRFIITALSIWSVFIFIAIFCLKANGMFVGFISLGMGHLIKGLADHYYPAKKC